MTNVPSFSCLGNFPSMPLVAHAVRIKFALLPALLMLMPLLMGTSAFAADPIEAKAKACVACHGENGVPQLKTTPVIWGQNAGYMFLQLRDFQSGARKNDLMSPIAATLAKEDLLPLAEYFSKLKWPNLGQPEAAQTSPPRLRPRSHRWVASPATSTTSKATVPRPASPASSTTICKRR